MKRKIKKELRYIRYKICRTIYYADHCPKDYRKNPREILENMAGILLVFAIGFSFACIFVTMA